MSPKAGGSSKQCHAFLYEYLSVSPLTSLPADLVSQGPGLTYTHLPLAFAMGGDRKTCQEDVI